MKYHITDDEIQVAAYPVAAKLCSLALQKKSVLRVHPVPRGGVPAFYAIREAYLNVRRDIQSHGEHLAPPLELVTDPTLADVFVDDLVDSGATQLRFAGYGKPFFSLFNKDKGTRFEGRWLVFPWEGNEQGSVDDIFTRLLQYIGEDPTRGGLVDTPARMAKAWSFWSSGYTADPVAVLKTFEDGAERYDEMIHSGVIPFYSQCEHHLAPFFGTVQFAYIPDKRIVGLSKMKRLVDVFARRLQVQERLTVQIVDSFTESVKPLGCACVIQARHLCMESRGIEQQGIITTTSALRGVFKTQAETRAEFYALSNR